MPAFKTILRWVGKALLWAVVAIGLAATIVPHYLDRIYYRGPVSDHFDGQHFFNPDRSDAFDGMPPSRVNGVITRMLLGDPTRPVWPIKIAVTPDKPPARVEGGDMRVTWVGHASLLVQADGVNILTDPVWSRKTGPFGMGPERVADPGIRFEDLPKIDLVLLSHNHYDHMDLPTLKRIWDRDRPLIATGLGNDAILRSAGIEADGMDWGDFVLQRKSDKKPHTATECALDPNSCGTSFTVYATRNHHWDSRWFTDRNRALWSSFVVELPHGNFFFSGDTGIGDGKWPAEAAALGPIRFAAIPIGAFRFEDKTMRGDSHIGPWDAVRVWDGLGRPFAIPIHWGTFRLSWEGYNTPPTMLAAMMKCAGEDPSRFTAAGIGRAVMVPPLGGTPKPADMSGIERCDKAGAFDGMK